MLLLNYDFYDLHAFIIFLRNNYGCTDFIPAISDLKKYIDAEQKTNGINTNTVRKILRPHSEKFRNELIWVFTDNRYTANLYVIKSKLSYAVMSEIFAEMLLCCENDFKRFSLLCDSSHNIPLYLVDDKHPKRAIACSLKEYHKQYSPEFLTNLLKQQ